jgi:DNA adenine methylase
MRTSIIDTPKIGLLPVPTRPPLRYHGGKWRIAPWIITHFPKHRAYVEVFGGAAGVLLRKPRSIVEVYNDLDSQVFGFFKVLRDPIQRDQLIDLVALTPFCREEFELSYQATPDPIEAARRFALRTYFGHGTSGMDPRDSNGFRSCDIRAGKSYAREWLGIPNAIANAGHRLQGVTIENLHFRRLIPKFADPRTLFYCDPPYVMSTRNAGGKGYVHEMVSADHRELAWLLKSSKAIVVVSGYDSDLYRELYAGWNRVEKKVSANGQLGSVSRTEVLWMNF